MCFREAEQVQEKSAGIPVTAAMRVNPSQEGQRRAVHWAGTHLRPGDLVTKNSGSKDDTKSQR